jgi:hypothetical protein
VNFGTPASFSRRGGRGDIKSNLALLHGCSNIDDALTQVAADSSHDAVQSASDGAVLNRQLQVAPEAFKADA